MSAAERIRPPHVQRAIDEGNTQRLSEMGRSGNYSPKRDRSAAATLAAATRAENKRRASIPPFPPELMPLIRLDVANRQRSVDAAARHLYGLGENFIPMNVEDVD